ncbi:hydrolase [Phormidium tenue FACHB-886]|nr:hydrolase [Phormidium tenue FACHB-886]
MEYPCSACGFEVFDEPPGSYNLCPVCDWDDDGVQLRYPAMRGGANRESLFEYQQKWLKILPPSVKEAKGYRRDEQWRPLALAECEIIDEMPQSGHEYFDSIDAEEPKYYWRV